MNFEEWKVSDLIAFVSIVILGASFIAPTFVAIVQRKTELKSKKLDIFKDNFAKRYDRQYLIFQEFIENSGRIIAMLDSKTIPDQSEIQIFESSALKCLIFLTPYERTQFDMFRINVKKELGISDPREKLTPLSSNYISQTLLGMTQIHTFLNNKKVVNKLYSSFNDCIKISSRKLIEIEEEESRQLNNITESFVGVMSNKFIKFIVLICKIIIDFWSSKLKLLRKKY
ncbi:hypothetical protein [Streptococcus uberis]|uniref:hypothetical protein n=1 Tax=Streptococcus uberis TaxID=1349 RepID=UPI0012B5767E|nr:hypothetical protein [Streptococcus uberis]MCR4252900.1 hypothetical protein [Streptococcus uberis]MCR4254715.1 hypothetical protein [Streptococcus uberis]MCR4259665.1 hypothetical protein [Streptococcus uberis]MCR4262280.1 hypothetical protein [Streptococcus uberis]MCV6816413.1 hypothetical protein [Streptococcus uberis]